MTLNEHLTCPKCGYDLYGIPEVRCPECDFRYDAGALRSMAASAEWIRLVAARTLILRASAAAALAVPAVLDRFAISDLASFVVVGVVYFAAFLTWIVLTDSYVGLASIPNLIVVFLGIGLAFVFVGNAVPWIALGLATVLLFFAWTARTRHWPHLAPPGNAPSTELRRSVVRHSVAGNVLLIAASLLVAVSLLH